MYIKHSIIQFSVVICSLVSSSYALSSEAQNDIEREQKRCKVVSQIAFTSMSLRQQGYSLEESTKKVDDNLGVLENDSFRKSVSSTFPALLDLAFTFSVKDTYDAQKSAVESFAKMLLTECVKGSLVNSLTAGLQDDRPTNKTHYFKHVDEMGDGETHGVVFYPVDFDKRFFDNNPIMTYSCLNGKETLKIPKANGRYQFTEALPRRETQIEFRFDDDKKVVVGAKNFYDALVLTQSDIWITENLLDKKILKIRYENNSKKLIKFDLEAGNQSVKKAKTLGKCGRRLATAEELIQPVAKIQKLKQEVLKLAIRFDNSIHSVVNEAIVSDGYYRLPYNERNRFLHDIKTFLLNNDPITLDEIIRIIKQDGIEPSFTARAKSAFSGGDDIHRSTPDGPVGKLTSVEKKVPSKSTKVD